MAVRLVKRGGRIFFEDTEAPVTSPLAANIRGAGPDSAKMFGTPAQRQSVAEEANLATAQRRAQARTEQTAFEQAKVAAGQKLGGLADLGQTAQTLVGRTLQAGGEAAQAQALDVIPAEVQAYLDNPSDINRLKTAAQALGYTLPIETADDIQAVSNFLNQSMPQITEDLTGAVAATLGSNLVLNEDDYRQLGFEDIQEAANLLGTTVEDLQNKTLSEVIDRAQAQIQQEYSQVESLTAQANDPNVGAAQRAEARKQLRDLGAVGIRTIESDVDELADAIENQSQVEIAGQAVPIEQLLSSDYVTGLAKQYYSLDAEGRADFAKTDPDLATFFNRHEQAISGIVDQVDSATAELANLNRQNLALAQTAGGATLSDRVMQAVFPDFGKLRDQSYDIGRVPLVQVLKSGSLNVAEEQAVTSNLDKLYKLSPELVKQALQQGTSVQELNRWGLLGNIEPTLSYIDKLSRANVADVVGADDLNSVRELLRDASLRQKTGLFSGTPPLSLLVDAQNEINSATIPTTLDELAQIDPNKFTKQMADLQSYVGRNNQIYSTFEPALKSGSRSQFRRILDSVDKEFVKNSMDSNLYTNLTPEMKQEMANRFNRDVRRESVNRFLSEAGMPENFKTLTDVDSYLKDFPLNREEYRNYVATQDPRTAHRNMVSLNTLKSDFGNRITTLESIEQSLRSEKDTAGSAATRNIYNNALKSIEDAKSRMRRVISLAEEVGMEQLPGQGVPLQPLLVIYGR